MGPIHTLKRDWPAFCFSSINFVDNLNFEDLSFSLCRLQNYVTRYCDYYLPLFLCLKQFMHNFINVHLNLFKPWFIITWFWIEHRSVLDPKWSLNTYFPI